MPNPLAVLDVTTADRLAKLCGMFGSAHDGERAAAAALADRLIRALGLTWRDIFMAPSSEPQEQEIRSEWVEPQTIGGAIHTARVHRHLLTEWEAMFSMNLRSARLSPKQAAILGQILDKIRAHHRREAAAP